MKAGTNTKSKKEIEEKKEKKSEEREGGVEKMKRARVIKEKIHSTSLTTLIPRRQTEKGVGKLR